MKAEDLRKGNFVFVNNLKYRKELQGIPLTVNGIQERSNELFPNSNNVVSLLHVWDTVSQFEEFIEPIPITEEWLLKFGFSKIGENFDLKGFCIWWSTIVKEYHFRINGSGIHLKHIHQLQNLYHALTGEELTLKD